jgi:hypothetical protein
MWLRLWWWYHIHPWREKNKATFFLALVVAHSDSGFTENKFFLGMCGKQMNISCTVVL